MAQHRGADFVAWLRTHNAAIPVPARRVGFYGLDLYRLHASMRAVVAYLDHRAPEAARAARRSYARFEQFGPDAEGYAWASSRLGDGTCEDAAACELIALRERAAVRLHHDGAAASDEYFYAVQDARLARNAECHYHAMFRGRVSSWNRRDEHMAETPDELLSHLRHRGQAPKVVVWAHNVHVGDARATGLGESGELSLGQLVRERHRAEAKLIGFTTFTGTVVAAAGWDEAGRLRPVRPALAGSYEALSHEIGMPRFVLPLDRGTRVHAALANPRLERAIGIVYRPETERDSHYFEARLSDQFDLVVHFDESHAVNPLERIAAWEPREAPATFPSGV